MTCTNNPKITNYSGHPTSGCVPADRKVPTAFLPSGWVKNEVATRPGASMRFMTALPADPQHQDPLDPERILRELPERERENFLSQYREALDGARTEDSISSAQTPRSCLISTKNAQ